MKWASALSEGKSTPEVIAELTEAIRTQMGDEPIDLAFLFVSPALLNDKLPATVMESIGCRTLVGCSGGGIIGGGGNRTLAGGGADGGPAPGGGDHPVPFGFVGSSRSRCKPQKWQDCFQVDAEQKSQFVLFADPLTFEAEKGLMGLDFAYPRAVKVGGLVSGGNNPGENALFSTKRSIAPGWSA